MKKYFPILLLIILQSGVYAPAGKVYFYINAGQAINPYQDVWTAVKTVEIGSFPDSTINHDEGAYGPGQIRQCKLDDYNLATGSCYTLDDCLREPVARNIFMWHMMHYNNIDLGIRRWNGSGPETYEYLKKVHSVFVTQTLITNPK